MNIPVLKQFHRTYDDKLKQDINITVAQKKENKLILDKHIITYARRWQGELKEDDMCVVYLFL